MDPIMGWISFGISYWLDDGTRTVTNMLLIAAFVGGLGLLIP